MFKGNEYALVEAIHTHTGIVRIEKNGVKLLNIPYYEDYGSQEILDKSILNLESILDFANVVNISDVEPILSTDRL